MKHLRLRALYAAAALLLLAAVLFIALFVRDRIIRPYGGDVLVVLLLYCVLRTLRPDGWRFLPPAILLFACGIECLQAFHIVDVLGLSHFRILAVALGSVFDPVDLLCYALGCLPLFLTEFTGLRRRFAARFGS